MRINIIGGGLAGCALAYVLKKHGHEPVVYEASDCLAGGASGNDVGLYNPRITADYADIGQFYSTAFQRALGVFNVFGTDVDWRPCGALHLMNTVQKQKRFPKMVQNWPWAEEELRIISAAEASDIAGVDIVSDCLYISKSGKISPKKLCYAYAADVDVRLNSMVSCLDELDGEAHILACGMGVLNFAQGAHLPLRAVRGQVTYIEATDVTRKLQCCVGYGGYIAPCEEDKHCVGSTFQRWLSHDRILEADDGDNIQKLCENIPSLAGAYKVVAHRAAVRTTSSDHFPVFGQLNDRVYVSTAHGSHGILSSLQAAYHIADLIGQSTE